MDQIYFWIIILFIVILFLDYCEKKNKKEKFTNYTNQPINRNVDSPYFEENKLKVSNPVYTNNAINLYQKKNINFKNFSTDSVNPPYLKCSLCKLDFNCVDFPYNVDDKYSSVCHKCSLNKLNLNNMNFPVYAKSAGRTRICKNLK